MLRNLLIGAAIGALFVGTLGLAEPASAGERKSGAYSHAAKKKVAKRHYRARVAKVRRPQVRGYTARRGGYSYGVEDSINTYGSSRTLYGGTPSYTDPRLDAQSQAGPFDHGFFFESPAAPRGGNSLYMQ